MSQRIAELGGESDSPSADSGGFGEWIPRTSDEHSWLEIVDRTEEPLLVRICIPDVAPEAWEVLEATPLPGGGLMLLPGPGGGHDPW